MPELPEVETIKNVLKPYLTGRTITAVRVNNGSVVARPAAEDFAVSLAGQTVSDFTRRGKFLTLHFESGDCVVLHLRMTGCLTVERKDAPFSKHTHLVFSLDDGNELRYEDARRFGKFWYIESATQDTFSGKNKLVPEPFEITVEYLKPRIVKSKKPLKTLLLDQSIIAGIGNIYSDEICFASGILPYKAGNTLSDDELSRLCGVISERITYFIDKNEITFAEYAQTKGKDYKNTPYLQIYGKNGTPCPICGAPFDGRVIGGRSSVFCKNCQR